MVVKKYTNLLFLVCASVFLYWTSMDAVPKNKVYPHIVLVDVINESDEDLLLRSPDKEKLAGTLKEPFVLKRSSLEVPFIFLGKEDESYFVEMCCLKELSNGYCNEVKGMPINISFADNRVHISYDSGQMQETYNHSMNMYDNLVAVIRMEMHVSPKMAITFTMKNYSSLSPWQIIHQDLVSALDMNKMGLHTQLYTRPEHNLWSALKSSNQAQVEHALVAGAFINTRDEEGKTPLMYAIEHKDFSMASMLLHFNPDLYLADDQGRIALDYAVANCPKSMRNKYMEKMNYTMPVYESNGIPQCVHVWKRIHDDMN